MVPGRKALIPDEQEQPLHRLLSTQSKAPSDRWLRQHPAGGWLRIDSGTGRITKAEWQALHGPSLVTSLQMGLWQWGAVYTGIGSHDSSKTFGSQQPATTDLGTLKQTGLARNAGNIPGEKKYHAKGTMTWYRPGLFYGNHELKSGFDYTDHDLSRGSINRPASTGNYQLVVQKQRALGLEHVELPAEAA